MADLIPIPKGYQDLLSLLKSQIRTAQVRAALAVNQELVLLYWGIGKQILARQREDGWGAKVIERLAKDLHVEFPEMRGLSPRNLKYMRAFAEAWPIVQQPVAQLPWATMSGSLTWWRVQRNGSGTRNRPPPTAGAGTFSSCRLRVAFTGGRGRRSRTFRRLCQRHSRISPHSSDLEQTATNGWSRNVLVMQIESGLYRRQGKALTNFQATLPATQSDLAQQL